VGELGGGGEGSNKLEPGSLCPMTVRCIDLTGLVENLSDGFRGEAGDTDPPTQNMGPLVFSRTSADISGCSVPGLLL
jgi:hypothetical protein